MRIVIPDKRPGLLESSKYRIHRMEPYIQDGDISRTSLTVYDRPGVLRNINSD